MLLYDGVTRCKVLFTQRYTGKIFVYDFCVLWITAIVYSQDAKVWNEKFACVTLCEYYFSRWKQNGDRGLPR